MFQSFEELEVWKRACQLAVRLYELLADCRDYGLKDQIQRSAVSIASNIAEGSERAGRDFARFLSMARGSAAELRTQLYIAAKVDVLEDGTMQELVEEARQISRMLFALSKSLKTGDREPKTGAARGVR
ncbi:MAG: four helix bundle protein [Phycisphaerae bacterium]|nr:four helix bundle protein [Phycisphaerae bacterium]